MKTFVPAYLLAFDVSIRDERTGAITDDVIVLTKDQLRAAQIVGQSSKELITRYYASAGYAVAWIGKAVRREATLDLEELFLGAVRD